MNKIKTEIKWAKLIFIALILTLVASSVLRAIILYSGDSIFFIYIISYQLFYSLPAIILAAILLYISTNYQKKLKIKTIKVIIASSIGASLAGILLNILWI